MKTMLAEAEELVRSLPLGALNASRLVLDRVRDNPEAARYFLAYGDWTPVSAEQVFSDLEAQPAEHTQVYVDFPFCPQVCNFCAFYPVIARGEDEMTAYVADLKQEIRLLRQTYFDRGFVAESLELGGGTPTYLPLHLLQDAVQTFFEEFPFRAGGEHNFEATPESIIGDVGKAKLRFLREAGFNRMSIGAQSFQDHVLKSTNRPHDSAQIFEAFDAARSYNFERINFDILLGLPDQTIDDFRMSVETCVELDVDIIEIYTMRYFDTKKNVPLTAKLAQSRSHFLTDAQILVARVAADRFLRAAGYASSNGRTYQKDVAANDFYADYYKHNFLGQNTLGVGRKSHSNLYPWQYANYRNLDKYHAALQQQRLPITAGYKFTPRARLAKLLTGALQLMGPLDYNHMKKDFSEDDAKPFDDLLEECTNLELLSGADGVYQKTFLGFLFVEEMLKAVYDVAVTPFNVDVGFLGQEQGSKQVLARLGDR